MRKATLAITLAAIGAITLGGLTTAQQRGEQDRGGAPPDMGGMLIEGLRNTPGCLGVDSGKFKSGKNVIIAWFEDKEAAKRWYYSRAHQGALKMALGAGAEDHDHTPLEYARSGVPIMVMAALTFTDKPTIDGLALPISQISIEIYAPEAGGAHLNGRLAPGTFKVEHMKGYAPPPPAAGG